MAADDPTPKLDDPQAFLEENSGSRALLLIDFFFCGRLLLGRARLFLCPLPSILENFS